MTSIPIPSQSSSAFSPSSSNSFSEAAKSAPSHFELDSVNVVSSSLPVMSLPSGNTMATTPIDVSTAPSALSREDLIYMAKLAERSERYDEMAKYMKRLATYVSGKSELSIEERNLFSVAFKNVVGIRRRAWRIMSCAEQKKKTLGSEGENEVRLIQAYRSMIETELLDACLDLLAVLETYIIPHAQSGESKVFYLKMLGDYHRYVSEFRRGDERNRASEAALTSYEAAQELALTELPPTHPIRLGLALNFSVFYYEILNSPSKACLLSKHAFDDAIAELDMVDSATYKDSTLIMQLLRDNLSLWTSEQQHQGNGSSNQNGSNLRSVNDMHPHSSSDTLIKPKSVTA